jgi:hypothetical protein
MNIAQHMLENGGPAKPSTCREKTYKLSKHFKHMNKISTTVYYGMKWRLQVSKHGFHFLLQ